MNSSQHDELAQMFAQNMQLSYQAAAAQQPVQPPQVMRVEELPQLSEKQEQPVTYISAHYTGTAHIRPEDTASSPSHSPPPPYTDGHVLEAMAETLRQHSIDPASLLPNQVQLFANADYEQRLRLLELWRIAPPSYPLEEHLQQQQSMQATNMEQEIKAANSRWEQRQLQLQTQRRGEEHMLDTFIPDDAVPISPIREPGEAAWPPAARMRAASIAAKQKFGSEQAEPYMAHGYQQAVDPVYAGGAQGQGLWQAPSYAQAMTEQIRCHADWEAMNERLARERMAGFGGGQQLDDEMEL